LNSLAKNSVRKKIRNSKAQPAAVNTGKPARRRDTPDLVIDEKELARRVRDADAPIRYMVVSE